MARITFVITNDRHHWEIVKPVISRLLAKQHRIQLLSFCEFRGITTPQAEAEKLGCHVTRVPPVKARRTPTSVDGAVLAVGGSYTERGWLHSIAWRLLRPMVRLQRADLLVVLNDYAFPAMPLIELARRRSLPYVLLQEGIRFSLPNEAAGKYGLNGARQIACWGQASADHFAGIGVPENTLCITGTPRFDAVARHDWAADARQLIANNLLPAKYLLFATNPIDDQQLCSRSEKLAAARQFVERAQPLLHAAGVKLLVKLHGRESELDYRAALGKWQNRVVFAPAGVNLHAMLYAAEAVVVWASTVGLEALMHGTRLAVLPVPGVGYVFDYVAEGAAVALPADGDMRASLNQLLSEGGDQQQAYLRRQLANLGGAAEAVADCIEGQLL